MRMSLRRSSSEMVSYLRLSSESVSSLARSMLLKDSRRICDFSTFYEDLEFCPGLDFLLNFMVTDCFVVRRIRIISFKFKEFINYNESSV